MKLAYTFNTRADADAARELFARLRAWPHGKGVTRWHTSLVEHPNGKQFAVGVSPEHKGNRKSEQWRSAAQSEGNPVGVLQAVIDAQLAKEKPVRSVTVTQDDVDALLALPEPVELGADWWPEEETP